MATDWINYIRERFPLYFRLGFLVPRRQRRRAWCLLALLGEAEHVLEQVKEAQVALIRLQWWIDQLEALCAREVRHPHPLLEAVRQELSASDLDHAGQLFDAVADMVDGGEPTRIDRAYAALFARADTKGAAYDSLAAHWRRYRVPGRWLRKERAAPAIRHGLSRFQRGLYVMLKRRPDNVPAVGRLYFLTLIPVSYRWND